MSTVTKVPIEGAEAKSSASSQAEGASRSGGMMANAPGMGEALGAFNGALQRNTTLAPRLIELVRLRVAFHNQCRTCVSVRYRSAINDGLTEDLVCSLEKPQEATDLTDAEKSAIHYADLSATDHLSIDAGTFADLRRFYTEAEIVQLGMLLAFFIGYGRLTAAWHMLDDDVQGASRDTMVRIAPWTQQSVRVVG